MDTALLSLAVDLVRIPSLTAIVPELRANAARPLDLLQAFGEEAGAVCERLVFEGDHAKWDYPVDNLFIDWGGDPDLGHLCFLGHTDVVPEGNRSEWNGNPFSGVVRDGFLFGRGATDMKGAVAAFFVAASKVIRSNNKARRPKITAIATSDEEWAAVNGTKKVLAWMKEHGHEPTAILIGEPSSPSRFGTHIKVGRRGSLCGTIRARGVQGHAAYPDLYDNPNRTLGDAMMRLHELVWTDTREGMPATHFETIAISSGDFAQTAIIPAVAEMLWNIRFTPAQSLDDLTESVRQALDSIQSKIELHCRTDSASMAYYSPASSFAACIQDAVVAATGIKPAIDASGGASDGRFVPAPFPAAQIVELGLPENGGLAVDGAAQLGKGGMHQIDERCSLADLSALYQSYYRILESFHETASR